MTLKIDEDNWLEVTINALEELDYLWKCELEYDNEEDHKKEIRGKQKELWALIKYLNKTN